MQNIFYKNNPMLNKRLLEIVAFRPESALIAEQAGADRIELCDDHAASGITPSKASLDFVRHRLTIDLFVMVRPRGGDFVYTDEEFEQMKRDIEYCKQIGCEGVVFGILMPGSNLVDETRCSALVDLAGPMGVTFHRAIDKTPDALQAVDSIARCGFHRILTSGGADNPLLGATRLNDMIRLAGKRLSIMPGGGVRADNIKQIKEITGAMEFHSSALNLETMLPELDEIRTMKSILLA